MSIQQLLADPAAHRGSAKVDTQRFIERLIADVAAPVRDTAKLLTAGPLLTRLYTTLSPDEMTLDPEFQYNAGLALVGNVHIAQQRLQCREYQRGAASETAAWRMDLPQGGAVTQRAGEAASTANT